MTVGSLASRRLFSAVGRACRRIALAIEFQSATEEGAPPWALLETDVQSHCAPALESRVNVINQSEGGSDEVIIISCFDSESESRNFHIFFEGRYLSI